MERLLLQSVLEEDHELFFAPNGRVAEEIVQEALDLVVAPMAVPAEILEALGIAPGEE